MRAGDKAVYVAGTPSESACPHTPKKAADSVPPEQKLPCPVLRCLITQSSGENPYYWWWWDAHAYHERTGSTVLIIESVMNAQKITRD